MANNERQWWKEAIVYQVYPFSFKDTTGNGIGDLNGITSKLTYLRDLGVDVIWLSPIYASPMKDQGYDISDYRAINPDLGTMADFDNLVAEAHRIGLKVVMDLVVNHTSDQHAWFQDSKAGGEKRDWYIWKPAKIGTDGQKEEPNNWGAIFGGSCWEWSPERQEYYLHVFDVSQPDLNWENPDVRTAVWDIMEFWLEKGCDGFRMDVINCISKDPGFPDVPILDESQKFQYGLKSRFNGPQVIPYLTEMYDKVISKRQPAIFTVGETPGVATPQEAIEYLQAGRPLQMLFHFEHMYIDHQPGKTCFYKREWALTELKAILGGFMTYMQDHDGWDSLYLENHDQPRIVSRWADDGDDTLRERAAKMLALFHVTGRGTVFIYQGQEIGMANAKQWTFDELRDVEQINHYNTIKATRPEGADMSDVLADIQRIGRDNSRLPISWDASRNAGFTSGTPWIKVNEDYQTWNVASQEGKKGSVLSFWQQLLKLRKSEPTLVYGRFELVDEASEDVYAYTRSDADGVFLVVCSFKSKEVSWNCPIEAKGKLIMSNYDVQEGDGKMSLKPYECRLYRR
ncbi:alpha amylase [Neohortaea acidophila]|uniref:Alpha amylase n=1 Tax=Neohortaea acidophila TaxID=245834 RepID=A0A6A6PF96_9PEZI|nr:alpha amylase [Neohortaea acidophila]KAF2478620.1 alpha amylase [Neohortaea acidophila]